MNEEQEKIDFSKVDMVTSEDKANHLKNKTILDWARDFEAYMDEAINGEIRLGEQFKSELAEFDYTPEQGLKFSKSVLAYYQNFLRQFNWFWNRVNLYSNIDLFETKEFRSAKRELETSIERHKTSIDSINKGEKISLEPPKQFPKPGAIIWKKANDSLIYLFQKLGEAGFISNDQAVSHTLISQHFCQENGETMNTNSMAVAKNKYSQLPGATPKNGYLIKEIVEQTVHKNEKRTTTKS